MSALLGYLLGFFTSPACSLPKPDQKEKKNQSLGLEARVLSTRGVVIRCCRPRIHPIQSCIQPAQVGIVAAIYLGTYIALLHI